MEKDFDAGPAAIWFALGFIVCAALVALTR